MSLPSYVWVISDLSLLICPPSPNQWDTDFYTRYSTLFLKHDEKVKELRNRIHELREYECEVTWALSDELKVQLYHEFPWNTINEIPSFQANLVRKACLISCLPLHKNSK